MTLAFSTKFPDGTPTYFINKIWNEIKMPQEYHDYLQRYDEKFIGGWFNSIEANSLPSKIHTIRRDKTNRWREGMDIHFVINNRTKDRFQFAPILKVKKIQTIEIQYLSLTKKPIDLKPIIWIDGYLFYDPATGIDKGIERLAINDGFDSVDKFFEWFSESFKGKIIHWTDSAYWS